MFLYQQPLRLTRPQQESASFWKKKQKLFLAGARGTAALML
jgi:hypothetical protein